MSDIPYSEQVTAGEQPVEEPGSLPRRILDTYFAPIALFRRFGPGNAPWAGVLLISAVLTAALTLLLPHDLLVAQIREAMAQGPQPAGGGAAPSPETMVMFGRIGGVVSQLVLQPLVALAVAGIATLVFGMLMDGGARYRQHLAVVSHAALVTPLSVAVTMFFIIRSGNIGTKLSLAVLAPGLDAESFAYRALNGIDIFSLWWVALIGVGVAAVNRGVSYVTALSVTLGLYLAIVLGIAALQG